MIRHRYKRGLAGAAARAFGLIIIIIIAIAAVFIIVMAFSDTRLERASKRALSQMQLHGAHQLQICSFSLRAALSLPLCQPINKLILIHSIWLLMQSRWCHSH
jgi:hypothetical protein